MILTRLAQNPRLIIIGVALILGALGTREMVDGIGLWIVGFVDGLPDDAWYRPFHPPPPSYGFGFRPVSIIMVKLYIWMFGIQQHPPMWFLFAKIVLSAAAYGGSCWLWLRALGFERYALFISVLGMLLGPHLFSLWYLTELDGLGAAGTLIVSALLLTKEKKAIHLALLGCAIVFTIFLKESSALMLFAILLVHLIYFALSKERRAFTMTMVVLVSSLSVWMSMAWTVVTGHVEGHFSELSQAVRWTILGYTATQLTMFVSFMGVLIVLLSSIDKWARNFQWWKWVIVAVILSSTLWPPIAQINHYETYYFDSTFWMLGGGVLLNLALIGLLLQWKTDPQQSFVSAIILSTEATMGVALLLSANPREDIATRLFLVCFPCLSLLVLIGLERLYRVCNDKYARFLFGLAPVSILWFLLVNSLNTIILHHARNQVDVLGHQRLAGLVTEEDYVLFDNFVFWLSRDAIGDFSSHSISVKDEHLIYVPSQLVASKLPHVNWGEDMHLEALYQRGEPLWFYSLQLRSQMTEPVNQYLNGEFSTLQHPFGLFKSFRPIEDTSSSLPATNYIEDSRAISYGSHPTPLSTLVASRGFFHWGVRGGCIQVMPNLFELPRRLMSGVPVVEQYTYGVELWNLTSR